MKNFLLLLVFIPFMILNSQTISASRDTMVIGSISYIDSITIYNFGTHFLIIDSIQCEEQNFLLDINQIGDSSNWKLIEEYSSSTNIIEIQPNDSFQVRISFAAFVAKTAQLNYTQIDTIYFYNNSINLQALPIEITSTMITRVFKNDNIPVVSKLYQNFPNPFNPATKIKYEISENGNIEIRVYDIIGREIKTLVNEYKQAGKYEISFYAENLTNGIYFYKISIGNYSNIKKMLLLK